MAKKKKKNNFKNKITQKGLSGILYVFLLAISLTYAALIWQVGNLAKFKDYSEPQVGKNYSVRENKIRREVRGYPIEHMSSHISRQDPQIAAFLLGVAKKESNWGKFSPKKNGKECYNYWGYRGTYNRTMSGYSCFDSQKQAVRVVSARLKELIEKDIDTPEKLVMWKCGWDKECAQTPQAQKWIADVKYYYRKFQDPTLL